MKIQNCLTEKEIKQAAFSFEYEGFTISTSNMFGKYEVLYWKTENPLKDYSAASVQLAIKNIDKLCK